MYTNEQLEEAMSYLRSRLANELSMEADVERLLREYAEMLVNVMIDNGTTDIESDPDVALLVQDLIDRLVDDCYLLGVDEREERRDEIVSYMNSMRGDDTLEGRVRSRCWTFALEVGAVISSARRYGATGAAIVGSIVANLKHPYQNPYLDNASKPKYGHGVEASSMGALQTITAYAIADAWMWDWFNQHKGSSGYYVVRGSSYPCDECDEAAHTGPHPITDTEHFAPLHPHCKCAVVFV